MGDQSTDNSQGSSPNATGGTKAKPVSDQTTRKMDGYDASCEGQDAANYHGGRY
jgi:hypothetical protein